MTSDAVQHERLLRRDARLAALAERLQADGGSGLAEEFLAWAAERDDERRSLAREALDRYRELNLLYDLAERSASLDSATVIGVATAELARVVRHGRGAVLVADESRQHVRPVTASGRADEPLGSMPTEGFPIGNGIVGGVAAGAEGEIVNDTAADPRATRAEQR
ncbi:MAG: hypothetical protein M3253_01270, partial [Chloroflexota bacterium]|nr:hypothetical protein [Chloroflexota bacterium]